MQQDVKIIAEIASAHEGDASLAQSMIDRAHATGADYVKLQIFRRDNLMSSFHPKYTSFGEIELAVDEWHRLLDRCDSRDIPIIVEAYDQDSWELARRHECVKSIKVPTSETGNLIFLETLARGSHPLLLGVGGTTQEELDRAVTLLKSQCQMAPTLLLGFQNYPTAVSDCHLNRLPWLQSRYQLPVGYADHVDGSDPDLAFLVPLMAVAAGASVIEKHITLDRSRRGRDHYSALNPDEFEKLVGLIRKAAPARGEAGLLLSSAEQDYRRLMKKHAVAAQPLLKGTPMAMERVRFKRTGTTGLSHEELKLFLGKTLAHDKQLDEPLSRDDFL